MESEESDECNLLSLYFEENNSNHLDYDTKVDLFSPQEVIHVSEEEQGLGADQDYDGGDYQ